MKNAKEKINEPPAPATNLYITAYDRPFVEQESDKPVPPEAYQCSPEEKAFFKEANELDEWLASHGATYEDGSIPPIFTPDKMSRQQMYDYVFSVNRLLEHVKATLIEAGRPWNENLEVGLVSAFESSKKRIHRALDLISRARDEVTVNQKVDEIFTNTNVRFVSGDKGEFWEKYEEWLEAYRKGICRDHFQEYIARAKWNGTYEIGADSHQDEEGAGGQARGKGKVGKKLTPQAAMKYVKEAGGNVTNAAKASGYTRPYFSKILNKMKKKKDSQ